MSRPLLPRGKPRAPLVMLTAYDAISARIAHEAGVDLLLVGDSAANTVLGYPTTREVTLDELLVLVRAVRRGAPHALLIGDLPFGSYEASDAQAALAAERFRDAGADYVKLEGAGPMLDRVRALVAGGFAVVGHVGLLPQGARDASELRARGRTAGEATAIVRDARALEDAGVAMLVVEAVPALVGAAVARGVRVPVVGIGAGADVDGQVLVYPDLVGLTPDPLPRFVRRYASLRSEWQDAVRRFAADVRSRSFPSAAESYGMVDAERARFLADIPPSLDGMSTEADQSS